MKCKSAGTMKEGTVPAPHTAPVLKLMMTHYLSVNIVSGGATAAGVGPRERLAGDFAFPLKIALLGYCYPLSIWYDECSCPPKGTPPRGGTM